MQVQNTNRKYILAKAVLDMITVMLLSIPALFVVLLCYIAIRLETKGPGFFRQERVGKHGEIFVIYKLRTMIPETELDGKPLTDMDRMTRMGKTIRALSLDELPQIWNIFKGEMSFIGPRPLLPSYIPLYTQEQMRRHHVRPGISGWAQVNGRNEISWEQKFERDVWYVDHMGFKLDAYIFWLTIVTVMKRRGINAAPVSTMQVFQGNKGAIGQ